MKNKPQNIDGDLLGLSVVEAVIAQDSAMLDDLIGQLRTREDLLGALRCVSTAFATCLVQNLSERGAEMQLMLYRSAMIQDYYGAPDDA